MKSITPFIQLGFDSLQLCACGCGQPTPIAKKTDPRCGHVKGQPIRYIHNHHGRIPIANRFWQYVAIGAPDECWLWQGAKTGKGYGHMSFQGTVMGAYRIAWILTNGPIPAGLLVRHKVCDNPPCCNPAHLALGTSADNSRDMVEHGRANHSGMKGSIHPLVKLTETDIPIIRALHAQGHSYSTIAARYGMTKASIGFICRRKTWVHVP